MEVHQVVSSSFKLNIKCADGVSYCGGENVASSSNPASNESSYICEESLIVGGREDRFCTSDGKLGGPSDKGVLQFGGRWQGRSVPRRVSGGSKSNNGGRRSEHFDGYANGKGKSHTENGKNERSFIHRFIQL